LGGVPLPDDVAVRPLQGGISTTMGFYTGLETARAVQHYQAIVQGGGPQLQRSKRGRR
jgi:hypothetical protein